jgi:uncharacterized protein (TIGR02594 family)
MKPEFKFLLSPDMPRTIQEAVKLIGVVETPGPKNNSVIIDWQKEIGDLANAWYTQDSIPWCGLFVAVVVLRTGRAPVTNYLRARDWAEWGEPSKTASVGDILVFARKGGGHVGFYVGENETSYYVLGGNQSDAVNITKISKHRLVAIRQPNYRIRPSTAIAMKINSNIAESTTEA